MMLPRTFALTNTMKRLDAIIKDAEKLLEIGQREAAVALIKNSQGDFVGIFSQFDAGYFSNKEIEKIEAYEIILGICQEFDNSINNSYEDNEGDGVYDW